MRAERIGEAAAGGRVLEGGEVTGNNRFIPTGFKSTIDLMDFESCEQSENEGEPPLLSSGEITNAPFCVRVPNPLR